MIGIGKTNTSIQVWAACFSGESNLVLLKMVEKALRCIAILFACFLHVVLLFGTCVFSPNKNGNGVLWLSQGMTMNWSGIFSIIPFSIFDILGYAFLSNGRLCTVCIKFYCCSTTIYICMYFVWDVMLCYVVSICQFQLSESSFVGLVVSDGIYFVGFFICYLILLTIDQKRWTISFILPCSCSCSCSCSLQLVYRHIRSIYDSVENGTVLWYFLIFQINWSFLLKWHILCSICVYMSPNATRLEGI